MKRLIRYANFALVIVGLGAVSTQLAAQTITTLVNFDRTNGAYPSASMVQGYNGNFFGVTTQGGAKNVGEIFQVGRERDFSVLASFKGGNGAAPSSKLVLATNGNFYGSTTEGGGRQGICGYDSPGCGEIYKATASGILTGLHKFNFGDGFFPRSAPIQASDGNFYGTTDNGGSGGNCVSGCGTIYRLTPNGVFATIHDFTGPDGANPSGQLIEGVDGDLYGTTGLGGGNKDCSCGTVFKVTRGGTLTVLYAFDSFDGNYPNGLIQAADGNFYGTTYNGGAVGNGTVFKIRPDGTLTILHSFAGIDGSQPFGDLVEATDGNFYGTTVFGGDNAQSLGTIFKITPDGSATSIHSFNGSDGAYPYSGLLEGTNGILYGATFGGGDAACDPYNYGCGTFFSLDVGLSPFISFVRSYGKVGQNGPILGQEFTGASGVEISGIPQTSR